MYVADWLQFDSLEVFSIQWWYFQPFVFVGRLSESSKTAKAFAWLSLVQFGSDKNTTVMFAFFLHRGSWCFSALKMPLLKQWSQDVDVNVRLQVPLICLCLHSNQFFPQFSPQTNERFTLRSTFSFIDLVFGSSSNHIRVNGTVPLFKYRLHFRKWRKVFLLNLTLNWHECFSLTLC